MLFIHWMISMIIVAAVGTCCIQAWDPNTKMVLIGCVGSELVMCMWHRHIWHGTCHITQFAARCHAVHHCVPSNPLVDAQDIMCLFSGFVTFVTFFLTTQCASFASGVIVHYVLTMLVHDELSHGRASGKPVPWLAHFQRHHMHPNNSFSVLWIELVHMININKQWINKI
jgi:hypothetical protein